MLGLVTIGQSPRDDVVMSMFGSNAPPGVVQAGALDGLSMDEIQRLGRAEATDTLVTRLHDGGAAIVSKERILDPLREAVERVERMGARVICVLCTGSFPELGSECRIVYPDRILAGVVDSIMPTGRLGVMMPHRDQEATMVSKWYLSRRDVVVTTASPYDCSTRFDDAARGLARDRVDAIVMDCMGYDREMQRAVRQASDVPVLLANGVVGAVMSEILDL